MILPPYCRFLLNSLLVRRLLGMVLNEGKEGKKCVFSVEEYLEYCANCLFRQGICQPPNPQTCLGTVHLHRGNPSVQHHYCKVYGNRDNFQGWNPHHHH